eukprot:NODE_247_length_1929_cov_196.010638_g197_i0.p1 GENE.NODE_247_length_1929_cov_196.010638_g197_i0~~NODE_247_length_1929_cov_196.010638_g197_i0.p1  ORF type:complete len:621 (+),score=105.22 NODE_247_length_1929_cov_196.010638_g197_i0:62-1864(+)
MGCVHVGVAVAAVAIFWICLLFYRESQQSQRFFATVFLPQANSAEIWLPSPLSSPLLVFNTSFVWQKPDLKKFNVQPEKHFRGRIQWQQLPKRHRILLNSEYRDADLGMLMTATVLPTHNKRLGAAFVMDMEGIYHYGYANTVKLMNPRPINATWIAGWATKLRGSRFHPEPCLWNAVTGVVVQVKFQSPPFDKSRIHHDVDFNPLTQTFLVLTTYISSGIGYDQIVEVDLHSRLVWCWDTRQYIPFNKHWLGHFSDEKKDLLQRFPGQRAMDWTHFNSVYWDIDGGSVLVNSRHLDTFWSICKASKNIEWSVGRVGSLRLYNKEGHQVKSFFWHAHALTRVAPNVFMLFDNNIHNLETPDPKIPGIPRLIKIQVFPERGEARELWSWTATSSQICWHHGDVDLVPSGNVVITFSENRHVSEMTPAGTFVWDLWGKDFDGKSQDGGSFAGESNRFLQWPFVTVVPTPSVQVRPSYEGKVSALRRNETSEDVRQTLHMRRFINVFMLCVENNPSLSLALFNTVAQRYTLDAQLDLFHGHSDIPLITEPVRLLPDWQATLMNITLPSSIVTEKSTTALRLRLSTSQQENGTTLVMLHHRHCI